MVASSSNLLLVAASSRQGQVRRGSTKPNDHDLTSEIENRRGYMIGSTNTNNISGINGTNLKDVIMLQTVTPAYASASVTSTDSITPPSAAKEEGKQPARPRPRRKTMVSTGVDTMKKMLVTDSSVVVVALPESPTRKHERAGEQRDDMESVFNNIRSTTTRKVLDFDLSVPSMPDMLSMPAPALPTPAMNQSSSKQKNEMSHSNNDNDNDNAPMKKKKKKQLHVGRRLRQIKKRLSLTISKKSSPSKQEEKEEVCLSPGTSATTSTSSFRPTSQEEEDDDAPIFDMLTMMTTTLKPRVRSIFPEQEEMMPIMPVQVLPAPPCPLSTTATSTTTTNEEERVVDVTESFPSKLDQALSVFSPNEGDDDGDDDVGADDDTDEWGIFDKGDESDDQTHNNDNHNSKRFSSRFSFTNHTSNPCFPPRTHLPVVFAATATAGAE